MPSSLRGLPYLVDVVTVFWLVEKTTGRNRSVPNLVIAEGTFPCPVMSANQERQRKRGSQWLDSRPWQEHLCPPPVTMWKFFFSFHTKWWIINLCCVYSLVCVLLCANSQNDFCPLGYMQPCLSGIFWRQQASNTLKFSRRCYKNDSSSRNTSRFPLCSVSLFPSCIFFNQICNGILSHSVFLFTRDTDTRFSSDTDFSEDPDGRGANTTKGKVQTDHLIWIFRCSF